MISVHFILFLQGSVGFSYTFACRNFGLSEFLVFILHLLTQVGGAEEKEKQVEGMAVSEAE